LPARIASINRSKSGRSFVAWRLAERSLSVNDALAGHDQL
jgi:hypothetical protein